MTSVQRPHIAWYLKKINKLEAQLAVAVTLFDNLRLQAEINDYYSIIAKIQNG